MIIADTSGLLAFFNSKEPQHDSVKETVATTPNPLIISPYVLAELDYLISTRLGVNFELTVLQELSSGAYQIESLTTQDIAACVGVIEQYSDQNIGIADASLVVLAEKYATTSILTLDVRHFGVIKTADNTPFNILN